jgi:hypothetical protein
MPKRRASCVCGSFTVTCEGDPVRISMCHCLACQRRTGSAFGVQARFPKERVAVEGSSTAFVRTGDDGGKVTSRFCPACGSTVCWEIDTVPGYVAVAVGAFADPSFPPPKVAVYEARRHAWADFPSLAIERHE